MQIRLQEFLGFEASVFEHVSTSVIQSLLEFAWCKEFSWTEERLTVAQFRLHRCNLSVYRQMDKRSNSASFELRVHSQI